MEEQTINFEKEYNGKTYQCSRVVKGTRKLRQVIRVHGVGEKNDPAAYGQGQHPISTMDGIAQLIAFEILQRM